MENIQLIQQTLNSLRSEMESSKESSNLNRDSVKTINNGLKLIDEKLQEAYTDLDKSHSNISSNAEIISKVSKDILEKSREIRTNAADIISQNSLIEDNSIRLYQMLIKISDVGERIEVLTEAMESIKSTSYIEKMKIEVANDINRLWQFFIIIMVYFTPLAFVISNYHQKGDDLVNQSIQNQGVLLTVTTVLIAYFSLGFSIMYGSTSSGWIGASNYLMEINAIGDSKLQMNFPLIEFILYQTSFIILSSLIVYMAIGQKFSNILNIVIALFVSIILIPIFGHWAWSGNFISDNQGWLENIGFIDQSGAVVINVVAAWFAFIIAWKVGNSDISNKSSDNEISIPVYSISSILLLWLSWFGFTTGTLSIADENIANVMLNISLAGSAGGLAAFIHYSFFHNENEKSIGRGLAGFIAGLVAIAACARTVTFMEAMVIGMSAGILQNIAYSFLRKVFLKQEWQKRAANLVAIHGAVGIWGALCVALLGSDGNFSTPDMIQLVIQVKGILTAIVYSMVMGTIIFIILNFFKKRSKILS
jgi:Amt family ammonium transporter